MCLSCASHSHKGLIIGKNKIEETLNFNPKKTMIYDTYNKRFKPTKKQVAEIKNQAIALVCTSVDLSCDIWAIQWPNNYKVKTF